MPMAVDQGLRLRPYLGDQLRHDLYVERDEFLDPYALHRTEDPVADARGGAVAGPAVPERHRADGVLAELPRRHQPRTPRGNAEHQRAGAADERAVEVEERRARSTRQILADFGEQCFRHLGSPPV